MPPTSRWAGLRRRCGSCAAVLALVPATAHGGLPESGQRWPGPTITYEDALTGSDRWALDRAVRAWNRSGVAIRFRRSARAPADLVVGYLPPGNPSLGRAQVGYSPAGPARVGIRRRDEREPWQDRFVIAALLAHELGHVLGLDHGPTCSAMAANIGAWTGATDGCRPAPRGRWRCGLLAPADVLGAVRLYGGGLAPASSRRWCPR